MVDGPKGVMVEKTTKQILSKAPIFQQHIQNDKLMIEETELTKATYERKAH